MVWLAGRKRSFLVLCFRSARCSGFHCGMQFLLQGSDALRFGDLRAVRTVRHVERVGSRTVLGADTGKSDRYTFASKAREQVIEQTKTVSGLDLNQGVGWVRLVIDCYQGRELDVLRRSPQ